VRSGYFFNRKKTIPHSAIMNAIPDSTRFLAKKEGVVEYNLRISMINLLIFVHPKKYFLFFILINILMQ
jgi:hypothetical protein